MVDSPGARLTGVSRRYGTERPVQALRDVTAEFGGGQATALVGKSGSGKSTLLHILGLLDRPDSGSYHLAGHDTGELGERERSRLRATRVGFVFQQFHLVPYRTALENVELALHPCGGRRAERVEQARAGLAEVGLRHRLRHYPSQLSGGEQQRVAIARALVSDPVLLLCDEPTGNLDSRTASEIMDLLLGFRSPARTIVIVTHDRDIAGWADQTLELVDGQLAAGSLR